MNWNLASTQRKRPVSGTEIPKKAENSREWDPCYQKAEISRMGLMLKKAGKCHEWDLW